MNKAYRLIWSQAKDAWVIVAEIVKGNGGPPPLTMAAVIAATMAILAGNADALPTGQQVVNGTVSFATSIDNKTLTVTNSPNSIINWQGFSIAAGERTTFNQQNAASAVLNRVINFGEGFDSKILGELTSNGRVFLINPNGILFGAGSQVNVAGLVASSLDISDQNFKAGRYIFGDEYNSSPTAGSVINQGTITTVAGGKVWLIAPQVDNQAEGIITAPNGDVILAAGYSVNMVDPNNPEIAVVVSNSGDTARNIGTITAEAGRVGIFGGLIDQQGAISANSVDVRPDGRVFLKSTSGTTLGATSDISGGSILIESSGAGGEGPGGFIVQEGLVSASGNAVFKADDMALAGGSITAPDVSLNRFNMGDIDLGSKPGGSTLGLDQADLDSIHALNSLSIGDTNVNNIVVSAPVDLTAVTPNLLLRAVNIDNSSGALTNTGSISLAADTMVLDGGSIDAPIVSLTRGTTWGDITLGVAAPGTLSLTQGDLDSVEYTGDAPGVLRIGDKASTGKITITDAITRDSANNDTLHLISGGDITQTQLNAGLGTLAGDLTVTNLALETTGTINLPNANNISNLAADTSANYGGSITINNGNPLNVASVDGVSGIRTMDAPITVTATELALASEVSISAGTGDVTLVAAAMDLAPGTVSGATVTLASGGDIEFVAAKNGGLLELTQTDLNSITATDNLLIESRTTGGLLTVSAPITTAVPMLTLRADTMSIDTTLDNSGGAVTLKPYTSGTNIDLGSKPGGVLGLLNSELDSITANNLIIENGPYDSITVTDAISLTTTPHLSLRSGTIDNSGGSLGTAGTISLAADTMTLAGGAIDAPIVSLTRMTQGSIDLGSSINDNLLLTQSDLDSITTPGGFLRIGDTANTDSITINSAITRIGTDQNTLHLISGSGGITQVNAANALTVTNLALESQGNIELRNTSNAIMNIAGDTLTSGGNITVVNNSALTVAEIDGVSGLKSFGGPISVTVDGGNALNLDVNAGISTNGDVSLTADAMDLASGTVNGATVTLASTGAVDLGRKNAGTLGLYQADLDAVTANNLVIQSQAASGRVTVAGPIALDSDKVPMLTLGADSMTITGTLDNAGGSITLNPYSAGTDIALGSKNEGPLGFFNNELNRISANNLIIENNVGGNITVSNAITLDSIKVPTLTLRSDTMDFSAASASITSASGTIALKPYTSTIGFELGTSNVTLNPGGTASSIAWDQIDAATRVIGDSAMSGNITVTGAVSLTSNLSLVTGYDGNGYGNISIKAPLSVGSHDLTLSGYYGSVTQDSFVSGVTIDSPITAAGLKLLGPAYFTLDNANNNVGTLAGDVGSLTFTNNNNLVIGTVDGIDGIYANGDLYLKTTGTYDLSINAPLTSGSYFNAMTLESGGKVTQTSPITAYNLQLLGAGGEYDLHNAGNYIESLAGDTGSVKLKDSRGLRISGASSSYGLTTSGDIDLEAKAEAGSGVEGIRVDAPLSAASITLNGTGADAVEGDSYNTNGRTGVYISSNITAQSGNITITGQGGRGVDGTFGGSAGTGGDGIYIDGNSTIISNGICVGGVCPGITLTGTGGRGGNAVGADATESGSNGDSAFGGAGGIGVYNVNGTIGFASSPVNITITGFGGDGGNATGGNGADNSNGTGGSGGSATGGAGGSGIVIGDRNNESGFMYSGSGNITLNGHGGIGGWGRGGNGGKGGGGFDFGNYGVGFTGGAGGDGTGGDGGTGIRMQGYSGDGYRDSSNYSVIRTDSGGITLNGNISLDPVVHADGAGGSGFGGVGGDGLAATGFSDSGFAGGSGGSGTGGAGGHGITSGFMDIFSGSGPISLTGAGGAGGNATGGTGGIGGKLAGDGGWSIGGNGGNGGSADGSFGGGGVLISFGQSGRYTYTDESHIGSGTGTINITGTGGNGGMGIGGNGGSGGDGFRTGEAPGSGGVGGSGGYGNVGNGGQGGKGLHIDSYGYSGTTYTYIKTAGTISLTGTGGSGGDAFGGLGGLGGARSAPGYGFGGGNANGGGGADGVWTGSDVSIYSTGSVATITLTGTGGKGGNAIGGAGNSSGDGGRADGGYGGYGIHHHGKVGRSGDYADIVFVGTGGAGGNATGGAGGEYSVNGGWASGGGGGYGTYNDGGSVRTGSGNIDLTGIAGGGGFGKAGSAGVSGFGGDGFGGNGHKGFYQYNGEVLSSSGGHIIIHGTGGDGGFGVGGAAGAYGTGGLGRGGDGQKGIELDSTSITSDSEGGLITLVGHGGQGGYGTGGTAGVNGFGGNGEGGNGGRGVFVDSTLISSVGAIGLTGYGGDAGIARGGAGGLSGGTANNAFNDYGNGGAGIELNRSGLSSNYGLISLTGHGGRGGDAISGNGGTAWGGAGGVGIKLFGYQSRGDSYYTIKSNSGNFVLSGFGADGGNADSALFAGRSATGGHGGDGVIVGGANGNAFVYTDSAITIDGHGGSGGWAKGGDSSSGFGGSATGGAGGTGIRVQGEYYNGYWGPVNRASEINSWNGDIILTGFGGSGGYATGGSSAIGYTGGSAVGGAGGAGIIIGGQNNAGLSTGRISSQYGDITLLGYGGDASLSFGQGGVGTGGGADGTGTGGAGGSGIHLFDSTVTSYSGPYNSGGFISLTGIAGAGGAGNGSSASVGGSGGKGIHLESSTGNTMIETNASIALDGQGGTGGISAGGIGADGGFGVHIERTGGFSGNFAINSTGYINGITVDVTGKGGASGDVNGIRSRGVQDDWAGDQGSINSPVLTVTTEGGITLTGLLDTVSLHNSVSGDVDYTDIYSNDGSSVVAISATNTAPYDSATSSGGAVRIASDFRDIVIGTGGITATTRAEVISTSGAIRTYSVQANEDLFNSGVIISPELITESRYRTELTNPNNAIGMFGAHSILSGDITLVNSVPLSIASNRLFSGNVIYNEAGAVSITNTGSITLPLASGSGIDATGDVTLVAQGAAADVIGGTGGGATAIRSLGNVSLTAGRDILLGQAGGNYADIYTDSAGGAISLTAGRDVTVSNDTYLWADSGDVTIKAGNSGAGSFTLSDTSWISSRSGIIDISAGTTSGAIQIDSAAIVVAPYVYLTADGGSVTSGGSAVTASTLLSVNAANGINFTGSNESPVVSLTNTTSGDVTYNSAVAGGLLVTGSNLPGSFSITETVAGITIDPAGIEANAVKLTAASGYGVDFNNSTVSSTTGPVIVSDNTPLGSQIALSNIPIFGADNVVSGVQIGETANTGGIVVDTMFTLGIPLTLVTSGNVTTGVESFLATPKLTVNAGTGITLDGANEVSAATLNNSTSGNIVFANSLAGGTTVSGTNSVAGGNFTVIESTGPLTAAGITANAGVVRLESTFGEIINGGSGTAVSGAGAVLTALNGIGAAAPLQTAVGQLQATNTNNAVQLNNSGVLTVTNLTNGGSLLLDNQGALTLTGLIESSGSTVTVTAHSPLTVSGGETAVRGYGTVTLFAGASGSVNDNLTVIDNTAVTSQMGSVILKAGENVVVNGVTLPSTDNLIGNPYLTAGPSGKVTIIDQINSTLRPLLTTQTAALLPGVAESISDWVGTMGNEATDLSDEEPDTNEGEKYGTEFSALPFCN